MSVPMTFSDLKRRQMFQSDLIHYARTVWSITTKFGRITRAAGGVFLGGLSRPHRKGSGP